MGPRLGAHLSVAGGLVRAVERALVHDCDAFQIFTRNANQWRSRILPPSEIREFRARLRTSRLWPVVSHASYLINLASQRAEGYCHASGARSVSRARRMLAFAMPSHITRSEVVAIAALARLELEDSELDLFARQLSDILAYATEVQQVDTTGVPPTATVASRHAGDRPDEVGPSLTREDALMNAPEAALEAGLFKVPRVLG